MPSLFSNTPSQTTEAGMNFASNRKPWLLPHAGSAIALAVLIGSFLLPVRGWAQVTGATLSGRVTDVSGAVIPSAKISIKNTATGVTRSVDANSSGFYNAPNLLPGTYAVTASASGFNSEVRSGITLTVGAEQVLNVTLQVGNIKQTVQVSGQASALQLATSSVSAVVGGAAIVQLPLNGRSWTDLASLQPGVAPIETQISFTDSGRGNRGFGGQLAISGSRPQQNNYRLDGISMNDYANGGPGSVLGGNLGVDAVQEFSVVTTNPPAEYGKTAGGIVNAITRSGTNQFHGDAYEFLRNDALDAANFFDNAGNITKPPFRRNQFGGSAGGPIQKDKTFIFGDYEGIRQSQGITDTAVTPTLAARSGQLCAPPPAGQTEGCQTTISVPVDPSAAKYLPLWGVPNGQILCPFASCPAGAGDTGRFSFAGQQVVSENFFIARVDHRFSERDSMFGTYNYDKTPFTTPDSLNNVTYGSLTKRQLATLEETHIFSPSFVNSLRVGVNRAFVNNSLSVGAINPLAADHSLAAVPGQYASTTQVGGLTLLTGGLNGNSTFLYRWTTYQFYDDAFVTKGLHSLKFGFSFERDQNNELTQTETDGVFSFGSLQDFLTNHPKRLRAAFPKLLTERGNRQSILGAYVQDDWRFRPNLTLNLGLRYEYATVPYAVQNKWSNLRNLTDVQPRLGNPYFSNPTYHDFQPRVGFAWDPFGNGKTDVRGAFGIYDSLPLLYQYVTLNGRAYPFFNIGNANNLPSGTFFAGAFPLLGAGSFELGTVEPNPRSNYVMEYNFNVQRQLLPSLTATVGYVGSHGVHQPFRVDDADMVLPRATSAGYVWPTPIGSGTTLNPNAGTIRYLNWAGSSSYNALQIGLTKRMSHGFLFQGSYTWSKSIDDNSGVIAGDNFSQAISSLAWFDFRLDRGLSDFNVGRTLVASATWQLPTLKSAPGAVAWATNGWELGGIFSAHDGVPFTVLFGTDGDPVGKNSSDPYSYPNRLVGAGCNSPVNPGNPNQYVKTQCYAIPTAPSVAFYNQNCDPSFGTAPQCFNLRGNSGRSSLIGPGLADLDFSLVKNNRVPKISENFNVQFRAEFFNVLNHANFSVPDYGSGFADIFDSAGARNAQAGLLTTTTTSSREVQFAVKVIW